MEIFLPVSEKQMNEKQTNNRIYVMRSTASPPPTILGRIYERISCDVTDEDRQQQKNGILSICHTHTALWMCDEFYGKEFQKRNSAQYAQLFFEWAHRNLGMFFGFANWGLLIILLAGPQSKEFENKNDEGNCHGLWKLLRLKWKCTARGMAALLPVVGRSVTFLFLSSHHFIVIFGFLPPNICSAYALASTVDRTIRDK